MRTPRLTLPKLLIALATALVAGMSAGHAAPISFTGSYTLSEAIVSGSVAVPTVKDDGTSGTTNHSGFTEGPMTIGSPYSGGTFILVTPTTQSSASTDSDTITVTFTFTSPSGATGSTTDTGTYNVTYNSSGTVTADSITWSPSPLVVNFTDGAILDITLATASGSGPSALTTTISLDATHGVPEPTSIALLGTALAGFGMMRRRRKRAA